VAGQFNHWMLGISGAKVLSYHWCRPD